MFWDETMPENNNYSLQNEPLNQQHHYQSTSLAYLPLKRSFVTTHPHPVSETYIPNSCNLSRNNLEQDEFTAQNCNEYNHNSNQSGQLLLSLDDHMTDDDYNLKQTIMQHANRMRQKTSSTKNKTTRTQLKRRSKLQTTPNKKKKILINSRKATSTNKLETFPTLRSHKLGQQKKLLRKRIRQKDPLYRAPYRISQMRFARRILPFRTCRLTNPFGCAPYYVLSLPRCVQRVLDHNRTNVLLPPYQTTLPTFPSGKRRSSLTDLHQIVPESEDRAVKSLQHNIACDVRKEKKSKGLYVNNTHPANSKNKAISSKKKADKSSNSRWNKEHHTTAKYRIISRRTLTQNPNGKCSPSPVESRCNLPLDRNAKSRRLCRSKIMKKKRLISSQLLTSTHFQVRSRSTSQNKYVQSTRKCTVTTPLTTNQETQFMEISPSKNEVWPDLEISSSRANYEERSNPFEITSDASLCDAELVIHDHTVSCKMDKDPKSPSTHENRPTQIDINAPSMMQEELMLQPDILNTPATQCADTSKEECMMSSSSNEHSHEHHPPEKGQTQVNSISTQSEMNNYSSITPPGTDPQLENAKHPEEVKNTLRSVRNSFIMTDEQGNKVAAAEINLPKGTKFKIVKVVTDNPKLIALTNNKKQPTLIHEVENAEQDQAITDTQPHQQPNSVGSYSLRPGLPQNVKKEEDKWLQNLPQEISTKKQTRKKI